MAVQNRVPSVEATAVPAAAQALIVAFEANLARIETVAGKATLQITCDGFRGAVDRDGQSFSTQTAEISFWRDGAKVRIDCAFDRVFDLGNREVVYHFPMAEQIGLVESRDARAFLQRNGTTRQTRRQLLLEGQQYHYIAESQQLYILPAGDRFMWQRELQWLVRGVDVSEYPLRERVVRAVQKGWAVNVQAGANGMYVLSLCSGNVGQRITIDANKGFTIQRVSGLGKGSSIYEYDYAHVGGAWVLVRGEMTCFSGKEGRLHYRSSLTADRDALRVNEPIAPEVFAVDDLHVEKGAYVMDGCSGERYLYQDMPITQKAALNRAGRRS